MADSKQRAIVGIERAAGKVQRTVATVFADERPVAVAGVGQIRVDRSARLIEDARRAPVGANAEIAVGLI